MQRAPKLLFLLFSLLVLCTFSIQPSYAVEENPTVHAVLFYSQTCPHCHKVINEDLPPLFEKYGKQLLIIGINTESTEGGQLYQQMATYFKLPENRLGVPALVVGETVLVGSQEIPDYFPDIIIHGLAEGGIPWPPIPGLAKIIAETDAQATAKAADNTPVPTVTNIIPTNEPIEQIALTPQPIAQDHPASNPLILHEGLPLPQADVLEDRSISKIFMTDPTGNSMSVIVLAGMILSVFIIGYRLKSPFQNRYSLSQWIIPALSLAGLIVAGYLSYVEVTGTTAVCGPVGDCNTVQQSSYARLFGFVPIGMVGLLGYLAIITCWIAQTYGPRHWQKYASQVIMGMALIGTFFSIYLTFLEPFVIGATCAWCLASAIIITAILWASSFPSQD